MKDILTLEQNDLKAFATRLSLALDAGEVGVWDWNIEPNTTIWDDRMFEMYGLDKMVPMPYDNWINAVFPEDRADAEASVQRVILNKTRESSEFRIIKPDNSLRHIHSSADAVCDDSGKVIRVIGINTDITERRLMEHQIQEHEAQLTTSNERFKMAQAIGEIGSWEYNLPANTIWSSEEGLRIYGLPSVIDELPIDEVEACIPEREKVHQALLDLIQFEKNYDLEFAVNPRDNSKQKIIKSAAILLKDENGKPEKVIGVIRDITEQKRMEESLQHVNEKLEMQVIKRTHNLTITNEKLKLEIIRRKKVGLELVEREANLEHAQRIAKLGSWQWDVPNNEFTVSKQWKLNHGVTISKLSMEDLFRIVHPDDVEATKKVFQDVLDGVEPAYDIERRIVRQDNGEVRYMHASGEVLDRDDSGKALKLVGFAQDITALKTAQDKMAKSESRFRAVMESVPLSIFVSTGENQVNEFLNKSFIDMFGYTLEELPSVSEWFLKAYPEEDYRESIVPEWQARVKAAIDSKTKIEPMDSVVTCKDGTTKDIHWGYISLDKLNYAFGLDITEQKQAEDERVKLHESQVAVKKEREKQKIFIATVSATQHILNNLLNGMLLFKMKAEQSGYFDDKTKSQYDQMIKEGTELVKKLSSVEVLTEESIKASVYPK